MFHNNRDSVIFNIINTILNELLKMQNSFIGKEYVKVLQTDQTVNGEFYLGITYIILDHNLKPLRDGFVFS